MGRLLALALAAVPLLAACGPSLSLSNLRCDGACQSTDDPFTMTLAVDYDDPGGALKSGELAFTIDGVVKAGTEKTGALLGSAPATKGTLHFTYPLKVTSVDDGEQLTLGVTARGSGEVSNEVEQDYVIHL